jgi:3',5'-nucleoside bisphosphate phosphatase
MKADLHNHSNYSDGLYSVSDLLKIAKMHNVDVMALTDHDSTYGCKDAIIEGEKLGITVIPGIELSTRYKGESVHIIGLFKNNYIPSEIKNIADDIKAFRVKRAINMMNNIKNIFNVKMDIDKFLKGKDVITRGNMFSHLLEYNPNISREEISKMISNDSPAYIESARFNTKEGIEFLKKNNCLTIYAHPTLSSQDIVEDVIKFGVDAIEYKYPKNKDGDMERYKDLALKYNLLLSAGSDFHGDSNHAMIGTSYLDYLEFGKIKEALK